MPHLAHRPPTINDYQPRFHFDLRLNSTHAGTARSGGGTYMDDILCSDGTALASIDTVSCAVGRLSSIADPRMALETLKLLIAARSSDEASADDEPAWLRNVNDAGSDTSAAALGETIDSIFELLRCDGPMGIKLDRIKWGEPSAEHLTVALRTLYAFRDVVPSWRETEARARRNLAERGFDERMLMRGLDF